jgi:hypothetical protein
MSERKKLDVTTCTFEGRVLPTVSITELTFALRYLLDVRRSSCNLRKRAFFEGRSESSDACVSVMVVNIKSTKNQWMYRFMGV